jgi:hypothetical protein
MRSLLHNHSISIPLFTLCILCLVGQSISGYFNYNQSQQEHHQSQISYSAYLTSGNYWETVAENFEGEFMSLSVYILLTSFAVEKGAKDSRKPGQKDKSDSDQKSQEQQKEQEQQAFHTNLHIPPLELMPGPIRWLYQHSLLLSFSLLFLSAFSLHCFMGLQSYNSTQAEHHQPTVSMLGYLSTPLFWLQSLRNWQAGFLSTGLLAVLSIVLRERGSPASKPPDEPDQETG